MSIPLPDLSRFPGLPPLPPRPDGVANTHAYKIWKSALLYARALAELPALPPLPAISKVHAGRRYIPVHTVYPCTGCHFRHDWLTQEEIDELPEDEQESERAIRDACLSLRPNKHVQGCMIGTVRIVWHRPPREKK
jgi:hypothetical protein